MRTEHVEGGIALSCESAPVGNGKRVEKAHHASKKMILPGRNTSGHDFSCGNSFFGKNIQLTFRIF
jgi:hypothetical protein